MVDEELSADAGAPRRRDTLASVIGGVLSAIGLAGVVLGVLGGSVAGLTGSLVWLLIGVLVLVFGSRARRRAASSS